MATRGREGQLTGGFTFGKGFSDASRFQRIALLGNVTRWAVFYGDRMCSADVTEANQDLMRRIKELAESPFFFGERSQGFYGCKVNTKNHLLAAYGLVSGDYSQEQTEELMNSVNNLCRPPRRA